MRPFFVEQSYQWRNEKSERPLQGQKLALIAYLGQQLGNPSVIGALDRGFRHAWGSAGVIAVNFTGFRPPLPTPGKPVDDAALDANPVLAVTHQLNNCSPPLARFPTALP